MAASFSLLILTVQAVPTLLSCLAFTSFSPLFLVSSFPFSSLFVSLSLCISIASWCSSPLDEVLSVDEEVSDGFCTRSFVSCKLRTRSWWCCRRAPRGFQLAMLFLTWSLLLLLFCMPCLARAGNDGVESDIHQRLGHMSHCDPLAHGSESDPSCEESASALNSKGASEAEPASLNLSGLRTSENDRDPVVPSDTNKKTTNKLSEEQQRLLADLDTSLEIDSSGFGLLGKVHSLVTDVSDSVKEESADQNLCRALLRAGNRVICSPAISVRSAGAHARVGANLDLGATSIETLSYDSVPSYGPGVAIVPSQLLWGQQPLFCPRFILLTIINTSNSSGLAIQTLVSDNLQFYISTFTETVVAPGGLLKIPVVYLPQSSGAVEGTLTLKMNEGLITVPTQGEGIGPPYKLQLRRNVGENLQHVISLFNPFDEMITIEEVSAWPEESVELLKEAEPTTEAKHSVDRSSGEDIGDKFEIGTAEESSTKVGLQMQAAGSWEIGPQSSQDILELDLLSKEENFEGVLHIRISGVSPAIGEPTLVFPVSLQVVQMSPVRAVPDVLNFGLLVGGNQASTQPLILLNSGDKLVQIEEMYEVFRDPKVLIEYERGRVLIPGIETEVANITYNSSEESVPCDSTSCQWGQKILVRTNSTLTHPIEVPYRALVLQGLECQNSPPSMGFVTESTGRAAGDLILGDSADGTHIVQGLDESNLLPAGFRKIQMVVDLSSQILDGGPLTEYGKMFLGLLFFALLLGVLLFFRMFVQDTVLPTLSGEQVKGGSHRKNSSRLSPLLGTGHGRNRDRLSKLWGWGALAAVADGLEAALTSALGRKDCSKSSSQLNLSHIKLKVSTCPSAVALHQATKSSGGGTSTKEPAPGTLHAGGRRGSSDRKHSGVTKTDHLRNAKSLLETPDEGSPVSIIEAPLASGKQPKSSKSPKAEVTPARPTIFVEASDDRGVVHKHSVKAPASVQSLVPGSPIEHPPKTGITPFKNTQKAQPVSPRSQNMEREKGEKGRRKKKRGHGSAQKYESGATLGASGGTSPVSPASPATPASPSRPVSPLSCDTHSNRSTSSLSDHAPLSTLSTSLSPKSLGPNVRGTSVTPLTKLDVNSLKESNSAAPFVRPESLSVDVASTALRQMAQAKVADLSWQASVKRDSGIGKKGNSNDWVAVARKNAPNSGFAKGDDIEDGGQSYRGPGRSHRPVNSRGLSSNSASALTPSATFPRRGSRGTGWNFSPLEGTNRILMDTSGASAVPPPVIAPSLRAPGARITKEATNEALLISNTGDGWRSLGFTANPELRNVTGKEELVSGSPRYPGDSHSGQSSEELLYDIWGNNFPNFNHSSSHLQQGMFTARITKDQDPVSGFHRLLVPDHSESLFAGSTFMGDMSPTQAVFAPFPGFFPDGSPLGPDQSHSASSSSANEVAGHLYSPPGFGDRTSTVVPNLGVIGHNIGTLVANVKPRIRVPYSPPMGCVSSTVFSPSNTPTAVNALSSRTDDLSCSFWSNSSSNLQERVSSPVPSPT